MERTARGRRLRHPDLLPLLAIALVVVAGNMLYLSRALDPNPMKVSAGLTIEAKPGILPGANTADPNSGHVSTSWASRRR